jgi:hypothetical protein
VSDFDDDDEQDVPFADHTAGGDHAGDRDDQRRHHGDDTADAERDGARDAWGASPGDGAGNPIGDLAGEARRAFGMLRGFVGPLLDSYPEVREHLTAAGGEIANAYRAVIRGREQEWREGEPGSSGAERITVEQIDVDDEARHHGDRHDHDGGDERGAGGSDDRNPTD